MIAFVAGLVFWILILSKDNHHMLDTMKKQINFLIQTPTWISILAGFCLVLWQCLAGVLPPVLQLTVFALALLLTGIPHGALDHLIEEETARRRNRSFSMPLFLFKYGVTMLSYALMWYFLPSLSLLFFLLISAWHFGETDIEKVPYTPLWSVTRFVFGSFVLLFILLSHTEETTPVLTRIVQSNEQVLSSWAFLTKHKLTFLLINFLLFTILYAVSYSKNSIFINHKRNMRLAVLLVITAFLPLLPAFALYFGGWHALSSFGTIRTYINPIQASQTSEKGLLLAADTWLKALPLTSLALLSFVIGLWYWLHFLQSFDPLPSLFVFLSLITLPHLHVMLEMNKKSVANCTPLRPATEP